MRRRMTAVIAIGVLGPEEPCLITGFDEDGKVLIGWNFFQDSPDPYGSY